MFTQLLMLALTLLLASCGRGASLQAAVDSTIYSSPSDGEVYGQNATYSTARSTAAGCDATGGTARIGQNLSGGTVYYVYRAYLDFDTASIPDDAEITSAVLGVCADTDLSGTDFNVEVYRYAWSEGLCDTTEANYDGAYGASATLEGTLRSTSDGWTAGTCYTMTVATGGISLTGDSKYTLVSSPDVGNLAPAGNQYVFIRTADYAGTGSDPFLLLSYTTPPEPTPTETSTATPTETPSATATPTASPTVTALCPVALGAHTTWGPGTVRIGCNVGLTATHYLTVAAGTELTMEGDHHWDLWGSFSAMGTASQPITITRELTTAMGTWGPLYLRAGALASLDYATLLYGRGINDGAGMTMRHSSVLTSTYGLATLAASDVMSCTLRYNGTGVLVYGESAPVVRSCNILDSTTWDATLRQRAGLPVSRCWWGADPPDEAGVLDGADELMRGTLDRSNHAGAWVEW